MQGQAFTLGGDVIVKIDDTEITSADDLIAYLGTKKPGDTVVVTVERDGKTEEVSVTLAERPATSDAEGPAGVAAPAPDNVC